MLGIDISQATVAKYMMRRRDAIYGERFRRRMHSLGIAEVLVAPRSPWQSPYVERLIGSFRRECLDHVIVFNERHLKRLLGSYARYHRSARIVFLVGTGSPCVCAADRRTAFP